MTVFTESPVSISQPESYKQRDRKNYHKHPRLYFGENFEQSFYYQRMLYEIQRSNSIFRHLSSRTKTNVVEFASSDNASTEECQFVKAKASTLKKLSSFNSLYITTSCSTNFGIDKNFKVSFGCSIDDFHRVKILNYEDEIQPSEECYLRTSGRVHQIKWIPDLNGSYPELIAIASNDLRIYQYEEKTLILKKAFSEDNKANPIISIDWNIWDPRYLCIVQRDGSCTIMSLKYEEFEIKTRVNSQHFSAGSPISLARFGMGQMEKCIIMIDAKKNMKIFDLRSKYGVNFNCPKEDLFGVECATNSDHLISFGGRKKISVYDIRNMNNKLNSFQDFFHEEFSTCFCWSSCFPEIYIGTSSGELINWPIDKNSDKEQERHKIANNVHIWNVHCPYFKPYVMLTTGNNINNKHYTTSVDTYLNRNFYSS